MHLCTCVNEEWGDGKGVDSEALSLLSLDKHRREVVGVHGTLTTDICRKSQVNYTKKAVVM